jgi:zinc protease
MKICKRLFVVAFAVLLTANFAFAQKAAQIKYEQYVLPNGLKVILHQDKSDPIVSLAITYHVGSSREKAGKTGFAHFFEHMLFQRSEHLPRNAFFQKISALGGTFNGGTMQDGTIYFETVPRDALEKVLWMESDRMGFFINTVTQSGLEREIDIVSNEKRQGVDTQPYGYTDEIISRELYPAGHPYSWTVIGQLADLRAATLEDVKDFYSSYYIPQNATLVLTGDFETPVAKTLIEKYFGEIKPGKDLPKIEPKNAVLKETKKLVFEDSYAQLPAITVVYPTVESYHKDENAIDMFMSLFAYGKTSPLYKVIVEEKKLAGNVKGYNSSQEIAGNTEISITPFEGKTLEEVNNAIQEAFTRFEKDGIDVTEMEKLKIKQAYIIRWHLL